MSQEALMFPVDDHRHSLRAIAFYTAALLHWTGIGSDIALER